MKTNCPVLSKLSMRDESFTHHATVCRQLQLCWGTQHRPLQLYSFLLVAIDLQSYLWRRKSEEVSMFARECSHVTWNMAAPFNVASPRGALAISDSSLMVLTSVQSEGSICTALTSPLSGCFSYWWYSYSLCIILTFLMAYAFTV